MSHHFSHKCIQTVCILSFAIILVLVYQHFSYKQTLYREARENLQHLTVDAAKNINSILREAMDAAESLARELSAGKVDRTTMLARLERILAENPNYFGGTITFSPYAYAPDRRLYSAYYSKSGPDGRLKLIQLDEIYDYTNPDHDWYAAPMTQGDRWSNPYWGKAGKTFMTTYAAVFYREDSVTRRKIPSGVVTIDISMDRIRKIIESLDIGPSGFGALTTRDGNYLYHPNHDYVLKHMNLRQVAREKDDHDRVLMAEKAARGEGGIIDHISTTTAQRAWLIFETVPISGWSLQNTFIKDDLDLDVDRLRQQIIRILIAIVIFGVSLSALLLRVEFGLPITVWLFTASISVLFVGGIGMIWYLALNYHSSAAANGSRIAEKARLKMLMSTLQESREQKYLPAAIFVPTGLQIETLEFDGANDLLVTGRIWQKYPGTLPKELAKGIRFGRAKSQEFDQTNIEAVPGGQVFQWSFQAVLRTELDHSRYPLEVEHVAIPLLPMESSHNLVLVPDLDAYKFTTPILLPGIDREVFMPGWKLTDSFFGMHNVNETTNFGVEQTIDHGTLPGLYYQIGVKRVLIDAVISNLTPLVVVITILFSLVLLSKSVTISNILSVCVAVFFVVVFAHLDIRKNISVNEIFYLEYFFFVVYLIIILVPMDAFRIALKMNSRFFEYKGGLLAQAIYWPSLLGVFFVITAVKFY